MTALRSHKEEKRYIALRKVTTDGCPFCNLTPKNPTFIEETPNFVVVSNNFPYSLWEGQGVVEHLMVVPKKHITSLKALSIAESKEYLDILTKYEESDYNIYTRSQNSVTRTVSHHHTHFIKLDHKKRTFLFMLKWPSYIRASF